MAGRGRGRGRGMSFNVESLGFGRGESLPQPILQPPPPYPPLEFKPVPLRTGDDCDYMLALKQEFRTTMRESVYYLKAQERKKDIARYSDKYNINGQQDNRISWQPDWKTLPDELKIRVRKSSKAKSSIKPTIAVSKKSVSGDTDIAKTLEILEKKEGETGGDEEDEEEKKKEDGEEEELDEEQFYDEEEMEEETDYILNYFDNGEMYGADEEDDNMDEGAIY